MSLRKTMNHFEYQKSMRGKSEAELLYIIKDAGEALTAMPDGINAGYYQDEIHYAAGELRRRGHARVENEQRLRKNAAEKMYAVLKVILLTPETVAYLKQHDRGALEQALAAVNLAEGWSGLDAARLAGHVKSFSMDIQPEHGLSLNAVPPEIDTANAPSPAVRKAMLDVTLEALEGV